MLNNHSDKQKSLKRRFLFILGLITFISFVTLGAMIIFWERVPLDLTRSQKILFGSAIMIYASYRFWRTVRKDEETDR
jgi:hypothetical protein